MNPRADYQTFQSKIDGAIVECLSKGARIHREHLEAFEEGGDGFQNCVVRTRRRDALRARPRTRGLQTLVRWPNPAWEHPGPGVKRSGADGNRAALREALSLSMSAETTDEQGDIVVDAIRGYLAWCPRSRR